MKTAYLKHPVSAEKKAEYRDKGFCIVDVAYAPEKPEADDFVEGAEKPKKPAKKAAKKKAD